MKKPLSTVLTIVCLCIPNFGRGESVQDLGLPNPVKVEVVFPDIVFGKDIVEFQTDILIVNSTPDWAWVEFDLYDPDGRVPALDIATVSPF